VPYQLHWDVPEQAMLELLLATELFEELDTGTELSDELETGTELFELELTATELLVAVVHTAPVTVGVSAAAVLFLSPNTPKLID
jgi:hypothetical protein